MRKLATLLSVLILAACAGGPVSLPEPRVGPDELLARRTSGVDAAVYRDERFWLNPDMVMRYFVDLSIRDVEKDGIPVALLGSLREEWPVLNYSRSANLSASDAFRTQQANCLSFSEVVISLMRHAGVRAQFQRVESLPQWDLDGDSAVAALHINAVIFQRGKRAEIDWFPNQASTGQERKFLLNDDEALAEWHNNIGTEALLRENYPQAFAELSRALRLSPKAAHIWVNLGVLYRRLGMSTEAESAWLIALQQNQRQLQAMSNLQQLYASRDQQVLADEIKGLILHYRKNNPYYHFLLAQQAERAQRLDEALRHIRRARRMHDDERFNELQARLTEQL